MSGKTKHLLASVLGGLLSVLLVRGLAFATIITVNSLADPGAAHICALRDAIRAANSRKAIHGCKAGTGDDTIYIGIIGTIYLASTLPKVTDRLLVINGPHVKLDGGGKVRILQVAPGSKLTIEDMTLEDGYAPEGPPPLYLSQGGAIDNAGTLTIANCDLIANSALATCDITDCEGGAIFNSGTLTLTSISMTGNSSGHGGAIYNTGKLVISNSGLTNNQGSLYGGGAIYNAGVMTITDANISNNTDVCCCDACGDAGGILNAEGAYLNITTTTISRNFSGGANGGIDNQGKLTITKSLIAGNTAAPNSASGGAGGGIGSDADLLIINSTIADNDADSSINGGGCGLGGGLVTSGGLIINSTIAYNSAASDGECQGEGGGIVGPLRLKNSIVAANSGGDCSEPTGDIITDAGHNLADDDSCAFTATSSQNNATVMLAEGLANNGGPTQTIALLQNSPAIDMIPLAACTGLADLRITTDQRGFPRPGTGETMCSIGAYEYQD